MRIIAGKYKSRRLAHNLPKGIRPTTDMARESMFNVLNNYIDFDSINVCDLFAGTGALGFEAISRGAKFCTFVDKSRHSIAIINKNANDLDFDKNSYSIHLCSAELFIKQKIFALNKFDLFFMDPPYNQKVINQILLLLSESDCVKYNSIVVAEHSSFEQIILPNSFQLLDKRIFGETGFTIISFA